MNIKIFITIISLLFVLTGCINKENDEIVAGVEGPESTNLELEPNTSKVLKLKANANEYQLELYNELDGTEITYGEMIEKVFPEIAEKLDKETLNQMKRTPMTWQGDKPSITIEKGTIVE